jgi:hypothetical protein
MRKDWSFKHRLDPVDEIAVQRRAQAVRVEPRQ